MKRSLYFFLSRSRLLVVRLTLGVITSPAVTAQSANSPAHHIELGMQAWTLNRGTFADAVKKTAEMGIHYLQAYPRQKIGGGIEGTFVASMDTATREKVRALLKSHGVILTSFGVVRAANEAEWREIFAFARDMGMRDIAVEPPKNTWAEAFPLLDRLAQEYGLSVTIHNHPNPNNPPADVVAALRPYSKRLGICGDTGHWARSGFDPVASLRAAQERLLSLHFKDLTEIARPAHDVPWGTGASNAAGIPVQFRVNQLVVQAELVIPPFNDGLLKQPCWLHDGVLKITRQWAGHILPHIVVEAVKLQIPGAQPQQQQQQQQQQHE